MMAVLFNNFAPNIGKSGVQGPSLNGPGHDIPPPTLTPGLPPQNPQSISNQSSQPDGNSTTKGSFFPSPTLTSIFSQVPSQSSQPLGQHQQSIFSQVPLNQTLGQPQTFMFPRIAQDHSKKADRSLIVKSIYNLTKVYQKLVGDGFDADLLQLLESSIFELTESLSETCNANTRMGGVAKAPQFTTHLFGSAPDKVEVQHSGALEAVKQQQMEAEKALEAVKQEHKEADKDLQAVKQQRLEAQNSLEEAEKQLEGVRGQRLDADKYLVSLKKTSENLLEGLKQEWQSLLHVREERSQVDKSLKSLKQKHSEADKSLQALVKACEFLEQQHATALESLVLVESSLERKLQARMTPKSSKPE